MRPDLHHAVTGTAVAWIFFAVVFWLGLPAATLAVGGVPGATAASEPPPWGIIATSPLYLEAPPELLAATPRPDQTPLWFFAVPTEAHVRAVLHRVGVAAATVSRLVQPASCKPERGGYVVIPPPEVVIDLPAATRQALYEVLAATPGNPWHEMPQFIADDVHTWLAGTRLSEAQKRIWETLTWRRGRMNVFSDLPVMIQLAGSSDEIAAARRAVTRIKTFTAEVRMAPGTSAAAFLAYWSAGRRNQDARPLLHALVERAGGPGLDLTLLLPTLGRERLYTYPSLGDAVGGRLPDCQWTALNFFAENPQPYYLDGRSSFLELTQDYALIDRPDQLGDLVCFVARDGTVYHTCVYLADGIVFTKNGENPLVPWILMKLGTVAALYDRSDGSKAVFFRRKPPPEN